MLSRKNKLDSLYQQYNRRKFVHPDPIEFLYAFKDVEDREIVGLIAASLAFGRVDQILEKTNLVLEKMNGTPRRFLKQSTRASLNRTFRNFQYRFVNAKQLVSMLWGIRKTLEIFGSLNA